MDKQTFLYTFIEQYTEKKQLHNTKLALPLAKELLQDIDRQLFKKNTTKINSFLHCMESTRMLIELHVDLVAEEEDLMLSSMLCHDLLTHIDFPDNGMELIHTHHLDPRILDLIALLRYPTALNENDKQTYYENIQANKLATLVSLANHANLVEQLSSFSISDVNGFIHEMKTYLLPICVYAKQHYQDCQMSVTILMEKIRCLIDVTTIIANRYQKREMAYTNEILSLMEENARLKGMIAEYDSSIFSKVSDTINL